MSDCIPIVEYLVLDDPPHLLVNECTTCRARYFDRRNACASCGRREFTKIPIPNDGVVRAFTIVEMAAPGVAVPFVAATIDCDGTTVRANLVEIPPDPSLVRVGQKVRLTTFSIGVDVDGTDAIGFGYKPLVGATDGR